MIFVMTGILCWNQPCEELQILTDKWWLTNDLFIKIASVTKHLLFAGFGMNFLQIGIFISRRKNDEL